jgi:hypothetical protein
MSSFFFIWSTGNEHWSKELTPFRDQCCGSGRFLTGSGDDFSKHLVPDPDPDLNKFSATFLLEIFVWEYALKVHIFMNQNLSNRDSLCISGLYTHQNSWFLVIYEARIRVRPKRSGSDRIQIRKTVWDAQTVQSEVSIYDKFWINRFKCVLELSVLRIPFGSRSFVGFGSTNFDRIWIWPRSKCLKPAEQYFSFLTFLLQYQNIFPAYT